jgi:hypothetical protein
MKVMGKLAKVPVIAPIIEGIFTKKDIDGYKEQLQQGKITKNQLQEMAGRRTITGITGMIGGASGAALGGVLGSVIPVGGNIIGAITGGILGDMTGRLIGDVFSKYILPQKYTKTIGAFVTQTTPPQEEMQDFIIKGNRIYKFSNKDEILGIKQDGAINKFLENGRSFNPPIPNIKVSITNDNTHFNKLVEANNISNNLLRVIADNTALMIKAVGGSGGRSSTVVVNNSNNVSEGRDNVKMGNNRSGYMASPYSL